MCCLGPMLESEQETERASTSPFTSAVEEKSRGGCCPAPTLSPKRVSWFVRSFACCSLVTACVCACMQGNSLRTDGLCFIPSPTIFEKGVQWRRS